MKPGNRWFAASVLVVLARALYPARSQCPCPKAKKGRTTSQVMKNARLAVMAIIFSMLWRFYLYVPDIGRCRFTGIVRVGRDGQRDPAWQLQWNKGYSRINQAWSNNRKDADASARACSAGRLSFSTMENCDRRSIFGKPS